MGIYMSTLARQVSRIFSSDKSTSVIIVGLANAGKSSLVQILQDEEASLHTEPTIGHRVKTVNYKDQVILHIWDLSGQDRLRTLWQRYYLTAEAVIFVIDSSEAGRFPEALEELRSLILSEDVQSVPIVVLANKQDLVTTSEREESQMAMFNLSDETDRPFKVFKVSIKSRQGIEEAMSWLIKNLNSR